MFKQKLKILGVLPILSILILIGFVTPSKAAQFEDTDTYTLEQTEIVEENLYVKSDIVDISGVVDSDLFIAANTVTVICRHSLTFTSILLFIYTQHL